jgi:hypothetical protein
MFGVLPSTTLGSVRRTERQVARPATSGMVMRLVPRAERDKVPPPNGLKLPVPRPAPGAGWLAARPGQGAARPSRHPILAPSCRVRSPGPRPACTWAPFRRRRAGKHRWAGSEWLGGGSTPGCKIEEISWNISTVGLILLAVHSRQVLFFDNHHPAADNRKHESPAD